MPASALEQIVSLAKRRGFVFPSSAIYGGLGSTWDYGPLGVELKNNLKKLWWKHNVYERDDMEGVDTAILMNRWVWKYSGHEDTFVDPMVDCRNCQSRWRADHIDGKCPQCGSTKLEKKFSTFASANAGSAPGKPAKGGGGCGAGCGCH